MVLMESDPLLEKWMGSKEFHTYWHTWRQRNNEAGISMGKHKFQGDDARFQVLADCISAEYGNRIRYIADVAGGQGMLTRLLIKKYNYESEVIDPRGWTLKGVPSRQEEFSPDMAGFYDLVVGLHPDQATRAVAEAALIRPVIIVPCCNFWSDEKLGQKELLSAIESFFRCRNVGFKRMELPFKGPKNIGLFTEPPQGA